MSWMYIDIQFTIMCGKEMLQILTLKKLESANVLFEKKDKSITKNAATLFSC